MKFSHKLLIHVKFLTYQQVLCTGNVGGGGFGTFKVGFKSIRKARNFASSVVLYEFIYKYMYIYLYIYLYTYITNIRGSSECEKTKGRVN